MGNDSQDIISVPFRASQSRIPIFFSRMAARAILRTQRPAAITAGLLGATGVGLWVARSYYTNNAFAESPEPPAVFSRWFGQSLRLGSSEVVNHNTKRLRFEFSNELLVKKYPEGKASTYLHSLNPGNSLYFLGALKGYRWTPNKHPHVTLIAGGAGITPMYQLIQGILSNPADQTKITLVFGVNSDADVLFRREFEELEGKFGDRFKAVYTVSRPGKESPFRKGYVTKELLEQVTGLAGEESKVFVCGPPAMEKALLGGSSFSRGKGGVLEELGYRKEQVHQF